LPAASFAVPGERGRLVFSSSEDPIRATGTQVLMRDGSVLSALVSLVSGVTESLFATVFRSDCRLCGPPLINISRRPVCRPRLSDVRRITGNVCSVRGERVLLGSRVVERRRETQSRIGLTRHQRRENLRGAFAVSRPEEIDGREIDDVFTTGTTASEYGRVLRRAGVSKLFVATVARTLKDDVRSPDLTPTLDREDRTLAATG
jgi:hypothetical protein